MVYIPVNTLNEKKRFRFQLSHFVVHLNNHVQLTEYGKRKDFNEMCLFLLTSATSYVVLISKPSSLSFCE